MKGWRMLRPEFIGVLILVVSSLMICTWGNNEGEGRKAIGASIPHAQDESLQDQLLYTTFHRKLKEESHNIYNHHKALFPLDNGDMVGFILASVGLMIAAGGGIGGGGMLVPIYMLIMRFHTKLAIPLSNITVLGGALANVLLNIKKRHPIADRPQVDWDLILMMEPLTIGGALIGALVNKIIPEGYLTVLMVLLLAYVSRRTMVKGIKEYIAETKELCVGSHDGTMDSALGSTLRYGTLSENDTDSTEEDLPLLEHRTSFIELPDLPSHRNNDGISHEDYEKNESEELKNQQETASKLPKYTLRSIMDDERHDPWGKIGCLLIIFFVVMVINILKGGGRAKSLIGIQCGSFAFWLANFLALAWLVAVTIFYGKYLLKRWKLKEKVGYRYIKGDVEWDAEATVKYPLICGLAGFIAGLFGIGGGIVKGPLLLEMGVLPSVASSTSSTMILFTSFTAATSFIMFGLLPFDYGVLLLMLGFTSTFIGQMGINYLVKKLNRQSVIILCVGIAVTISAVVMAGKALYSHATSGPQAHTHALSIC